MSWLNPFTFRCENRRGQEGGCGITVYVNDRKRYSRLEIDGKLEEALHCQLVSVTTQFYHLTGIAITAVTCTDAETITLSRSNIHPLFLWLSFHPHSYWPLHITLTWMVLRIFFSFPGDSGSRIHIYTYTHTYTFLFDLHTHTHKLTHTHTCIIHTDTYIHTNTNI